MSPAAHRSGPLRATMNIGEVLARLRTDFPDVTLSKIRFLEAEGLVEPERTPSGYRQFTAADVDRLRYVLTMQRDRFYPLRKIREHLDALDRGLVLADAPAGPPRAPRVGSDTAVPGPEHFAGAGRELRLSRAELGEATGVDPPLLEALESFGLVQAGSNGYFGAESLSVAAAAAELARYGIEPRHLRLFRTAAEREVGLVEQVVAPMRRGRGPEAGERAQESAREIAALCLRLHAALVRNALDRSGG